LRDVVWVAFDLLRSNVWQSIRTIRRSRAIRPRARFLAATCTLLLTAATASSAAAASRHDGRVAVVEGEGSPVRIESARMSPVTSEAVFSVRNLTTRTVNEVLLTIVVLDPSGKVKEFRSTPSIGRLSGNETKEFRYYIKGLNLDGGDRIYSGAQFVRIAREEWRGTLRLSSSGVTLQLARRTE
jgi:hypothetical protein